MKISESIDILTLIIVIALLLSFILYIFIEHKNEYKKTKEEYHKIM